ncbi:MAG: hypothetical protein ACPHER_09295, partial [Nevskiales bacterium]
MRKSILLLCACLFYSVASANSLADYQLPAADGQGQPGPLVGESRAGQSYDVYLTAQDGETIAFTVHEPAEMLGGQSYPLLLQGAGFAAPRINASMREFGAPEEIPVAASAA